MAELPPFPVDDQTLGLIEAAINGAGIEGGRSSLGDLCELMSEMGGSALRAVECVDENIAVAVYHPNSIIAALVTEVRRLRGAAAQPLPAKEHTP